MNDWKLAETAAALVASLSGGQSGEFASARLNAMNARFHAPLPSTLTLSMSRAVQQPALETWRGVTADVPPAGPLPSRRLQPRRAARALRRRRGRTATSVPQRFHPTFTDTYIGVSPTETFRETALANQAAALNTVKDDEMASVFLPYELPSRSRGARRSCTQTDTAAQSWY